MDVLVIGGGVTGTGVALDAVTRGLSVALVERHDLASGTSRWSSKLVHGGLRYLGSGDLDIAYESAVERGVLMERTAPHLTRALPNVFPMAGPITRKRGVMMGTALVAGDLLRRVAGTSGQTLPPPRRISGAETAVLVPEVSRERLTSGLLFWDGQLVDDARLVVAIARTAAAYGARILTYCEATAAEGRGANVADVRTGQEFRIRAQNVVNATGVWADTLTEGLRMRPSKGAHLVLDGARLGNPRAALFVPVPGTVNRMVFFLPQPDGRVYLGLTDTPIDAVADVPVADEEDERFLLDVVGGLLRTPLTTDDVLGSFAGLRPLVDTPGQHTADLSRQHRILEGDDGMLTVVGGKLTTYRRMAEDTVDRIARRPGVTAGPCVTPERALVGARPRRQLDGLPARPHLVQRYGSEAPELEAMIDAESELGQPIVDGLPYVRAELAWAVSHELALTVEDLLDRRTRIGLVPADRKLGEDVAADALERTAE